jgi:hypothetical protein
MRFAQIIEFTTDRIDDFTAAYVEVIAATSTGRVSHRAVLHKDRDSNNGYLLVLEFPSHELATQNSSRPRGGKVRRSAVRDLPGSANIPQPRRVTRRQPVAPSSGLSAV